MSDVNGFDLTGRVALVTGGQRGIGAAFAAALLARGAAKVYVTARTPATSADPRLVPLSLEVNDADSVAALVAQTQDVSLLINNAGIGGGGPVLLSDIERSRQIFDVNVFGTLRVTKAFAPVLGANGGGGIVTMLSVLSWVGGAGAYGASKAALWSLNNSFRVDLAEQGTLVVGVHVGFVETDMTARFPGTKLDPGAVARAVLDGVRAGQTEVLVDDVSRRMKDVLAGPPEGLFIRRE